MGLILVFLLGVGNFAMQQAVLHSGHPALERIPRGVRRRGGALAFAVEFVILAAALLLVMRYSAAFAWLYLLYSALNAFAAWLIVKRRI